MRNVELAETDDTYVILVDKASVHRFTVDQALNLLEEDEFAHIPLASDEEQADVVRSLEAMTEEERMPSDLVIERFIGL